MTTSKPAPGATAPSTALSTYAQGPGAGASVEEARKRLARAIQDWKNLGDCSRLPVSMVDKVACEVETAIDAFAAAVRSEALDTAGNELKAWQRSHEIAMREADAFEERTRAELSALRAALEASREDVRRLLAAKGVET